LIKKIKGNIDAPKSWKRTRSCRLGFQIKLQITSLSNAPKIAVSTLYISRQGEIFQKGYLDIAHGEKPKSVGRGVILAYRILISTSELSNFGTKDKELLGFNHLVKMSSQNLISCSPSQALKLLAGLPRGE
jgi:hypothetical protein